MRLPYRLRRKAERAIAEAEAALLDRNIDDQDAVRLASEALIDLGQPADVVDSTDA